MVYMLLLLALFAGDGTPPPPAWHAFPAEVQGWKVSGTERVFDRRTIFDYIDGGGEIYLAYGFTSVAVRTYEKQEEPPLEVAVFDMGSPGDAYGIYSYELEKENVSAGQGGEYMAGLLRFWKSRYFVCVIADKDTPSSKMGALAMGERIAAALPAPERKPRLLDHLPSEGLKSCRYFHTVDSLNRLYFLADKNILSLSRDTEAVLARYGSGNPPCSLLLIAYKTRKDAGQAFQSFTRAYLPDAPTGGPVKTENGCWTCARTTRNFVFSVFDAPSQAEAARLAEKVLQLLKEDHCER
ncbi:MAG: hypothetical protein RDV48_01405 [Candidatus Eremiobacteraeota bacterium]|nr:hypothetical protein [Candidatus Eremiobacteraeota bacterium]